MLDDPDEFTILRLPVVGVPIFCSLCGRQLVSFNDDGTFNTAALVGFRTVAEEWLDEEGEVHPPEEAVLIDATCLRRQCRAKRRVQEIQSHIRNLRRRIR